MPSVEIVAASLRDMGFSESQARRLAVDPQREPLRLAERKLSAQKPVVARAPARPKGRPGHAKEIVGACMAAVPHGTIADVAERFGLSVQQVYVIRSRERAKRGAGRWRIAP